MKLSEAISLGAMLSAQTFGTIRDAEGRSCALGAAMGAIGQGNCKEWNWAGRKVNCPDCGVLASVFNVIPHLNDSHRWPRQQIAEWVSTIEPQDEASTEAENGEEFASVGSLSPLHSWQDDLCCTVTSS